MTSDMLPQSWSYGVQAMPGLFELATNFSSEDRFQAVATCYQVDSINRTLYRSTSGQDNPLKPAEDGSTSRARATSKSQVNAVMDETQFRARMIDTQVLSSVNYTKWA